MTEQDEIKKQMKDITNAAHALYNSAKRDCPGIPNPTEWILQQDTMRASWERWYTITNKKREPFRSIMLRNAYSKYMKFMYDSYPPGFGDEIMKAYQDGNPFDGVQTFLQLSKNT
jgi:hypothetical protein